MDHSELPSELPSDGLAPQSHPAFQLLLERASHAEELLTSQRHGARAALSLIFSEARPEWLGPLALSLGPHRDPKRCKARALALEGLSEHWQRMPSQDRMDCGEELIREALAIPCLGSDKGMLLKRAEAWGKAALPMIEGQGTLPSGMTHAMATQPSAWLWLRARPEAPSAESRAAMVASAMRHGSGMWLPSVDDALERLCEAPWLDEAAHGAAKLMDPLEAIDLLGSMAHFGYGKQAVSAALLAAEPGLDLLGGLCAGARKGYLKTRSRMASHSPARCWGALLRADGWTAPELEHQKLAFANAAIMRCDMQAYLCVRGASPGPDYECQQAKQAFGDKAFAAAERRWLRAHASKDSLSKPSLRI